MGRESPIVACFVFLWRTRFAPPRAAEAGLTLQTIACVFAV